MLEMRGRSTSRMYLHVQYYNATRHWMCTRLLILHVRFTCLVGGTESWRLLEDMQGSDTSGVS